MRTSDVLCRARASALAAALVLSCAGMAAAQDGPVPPADIPDVFGPDLPSPSGATTVTVDLSFEITQDNTNAAPKPGTAAEAAFSMANMFGGAEGGVSSDELLTALEGAAEAGQPIALWRLGVMYENGEGVPQDEVRAFGYYSRIANEYANTPPRSLEADIVAQSFVKVGEYYRDGLPDAGIAADTHRSTALLMHAATYFADAEAQYEVGRLYLSDDGLGRSVLQSARWLSLAARKGHVAAQATLGDLLFNGEGIEAQPVEGLMWLSLAHDHARGTNEEFWIEDMLNEAMSIATPAQRTAALDAAQTVGAELDWNY